MSDIILRLDNWRQGTTKGEVNPVTDALLAEAAAEIWQLRIDRDWARSEFTRLLTELDPRINGVEWKWVEGGSAMDGVQVWSLNRNKRKKKQTRQQKQFILKQLKTSVTRKINIRRNRKPKHK